MIVKRKNGNDQWPMSQWKTGIILISNNAKQISNESEENERREPLLVKKE